MPAALVGYRFAFGTLAESVEFTTVCVAGHLVLPEPRERTTRMGGVFNRMLISRD